MLIERTCFDTVLIKISQYGIQKDITLIVSDRRKRITIKRDVLQAANILRKIFVRIPGRFSYALGGNSSTCAVGNSGTALFSQRHTFLSFTNNNSQYLQYLAEKPFRNHTAGVNNRQVRLSLSLPFLYPDKL